jgi:hypothetical protein
MSALALTSLEHDATSNKVPFLGLTIAIALADATSSLHGHHDAQQANNDSTRSGLAKDEH